MIYQRNVNLASQLARVPYNFLFKSVVKPSRNISNTSVKLCISSRLDQVELEQVSQDTLGVRTKVYTLLLCSDLDGGLTPLLAQDATKHPSIVPPNCHNISDCARPENCQKFSTTKLRLLIVPLSHTLYTELASVVWRDRALWYEGALFVFRGGLLWDSGFVLMKWGNVAKIEELNYFSVRCDTLISGLCFALTHFYYKGPISVHTSSRKLHFCYVSAHLCNNRN